MEWSLHLSRTYLFVIIIFRLRAAIGEMRIQLEFRKRNFGVADVWIGGAISLNFNFHKFIDLFHVYEKRARVYHLGNKRINRSFYRHRQPGTRDQQNDCSFTPYLIVTGKYDDVESHNINFFPCYYYYEWSLIAPAQVKIHFIGSHRSGSQILKNCLLWSRDVRIKRKRDSIEKHS